MDRDTDGARLIGDRAGDRLADPPGRIGRELVAAAILELVDRLHQADVAFLDQVQELQAAVGVFLGDRDHQAQVGLDHFLLGLAGFALALLDDLDDALELRRHIEAGNCAHTAAMLASVLSLIVAVGITLGKLLPAFARTDPPDARASQSRLKLMDPDAVHRGTPPA